MMSILLSFIFLEVISVNTGWEESEKKGGKIMVSAIFSAVMGIMGLFAFLAFLALSSCALLSILYFIYCLIADLYKRIKSKLD